MKKYRRILISSILMMGVILFITNSCKKDDVPGPIPELTTTVVSNIASTSAVSGGNITSDGGTAVTVRGVCWSIGHTPKINDSNTLNGAGAGSFTSIIKGLNASTSYFVRAYATNKNGTGYGMTLSFTTNNALLPILTTDTVKNLASTTASCGGKITNDYGSPITARGVCWSTNSTPFITNSKTTDGSGIGNFKSIIIGLNAYTFYYVRAYATNSAGTGYGNSLLFMTQYDSTTLPVVSTNAVTNITKISASCGGNVTSAGGSPIIARGICWSTGQTPTISDSKTTGGSGVGYFSCNITGLNPNTTYYVRAYSTNNAGIAYGNVVSFITQSATLALLTSQILSNIKATTATSGGVITSDGGTIVTSRGVCYSTNSNPTITDNITIDGGGLGNFKSNLTGLINNTKYYLKAYAINSVGTAYGNELSFTTQDGIIKLTTTPVSLSNLTTVITGGNITSDGGSNITVRGVCYSTIPNPTILDNKTIDSTGIGSFTSIIAGLAKDTKYYIRAYATNSVGTEYGNEISLTTTLIIGLPFQGGIIAYILHSGDPGYDANEPHGLIVATSDQSTGLQWYNGNYLGIGATATALGTGNANTNKIVTNQGSGNYAAKLCYDLVLGGYSDWYLPSKDELNILYLNKAAIGVVFSSSWSSSEYSNDQAWVVSLFDGGSSHETKNYQYPVRAIRSF